MSLAETVPSEVTSDQQITDQTHAAVEGSPADGGSAVEKSGANGSPQGHVDPPVIDEALAELARFHELDPADFSSREQLERAVGRLDRIYSHRIKEGWGQPQQTSREAQQQKQPPATKPSPWDHGIKPLAGPDYDPAIVEYSTSVVKALDGLKERLAQYEEKFGALEPYGEKITAFEQYMQQKSAEEYTAQMDAAFTGLGKEWEEMFGKGDYSSLPPHSIARQKRDELAMELAAIQHGDIQTGRRSPFKQQFERALRAAFGSHLPTIERRRLATAAHERKNGALSTPARRPAPPAATDEAAVMNRLKEWRERVESHN